MTAVVRTVDAFNNVSPVSTPTTVTPAAAPVGGVMFFTNGACTAGSGGAFVLNPGESQGAFFMKGGALTAGSTVSVSVSSSPALALVTPQTETIIGGLASKLAITGAGQTLMAGECSQPLTVLARDAANNPTTVAANTAVGLSASPNTGFLFFSNAACSGGGTASVQLNQGSGSTTFYVKGITGNTFDLTASAAGFTPDTQPVVVQPAVRTGTCVLGNGAASVTCTVTPALNATLSRTLMLFQATTDGTTGLENTAVRCVLTDATTITCSRGGTTGVVDVRWYTLSRPSGLTVERIGPIASTAVTSQAVPITSVSSASSTFVLMSSQTATATATTYNEKKLTSARLTAANTVTLQRLVAPDVAMTHSLQIVQWVGAAVVRDPAPGVILNGQRTGSVTGLADTTTNPTFLLSTWRWGDASGPSTEICHLGIRGALASSTSLGFSRADNNGANACNDNDMLIEFERVMLPAAANRVDAYTIDSTVSLTQTVPAVDLTRTVVFFSGQGFGGGQSWGETQDTTPDQVSDVTARASFVSPTSVSIARGAGATNPAQWSMFVWQLVP
jgi:hypothetical protein